ncbi:DUF2130 domain-containing protein [Phnomibacter ginsenosidimutans]|uniref:DUF2130 domain-containing protein n=1 Tax=Phnomibacter ginsenosidimutans TaxID=2676868 RepID=A0A6I6G8W9_9BACT|nr:DUF2130 domain-containing protein [Phnomibacter ginsenosidimutans]QGW27933.1 DUF2130 domain-containing protein [Phnomibacter ginsenosidimutans]
MPQVICPNCNHKFEPTDAMREELRNQMKDWQQKKDDEYRQRENQLKTQLEQKDREAALLLEQEKKKLAETLEANLRKQLSGDYEVQMKLLQEQLANNDEKLKEARQKELNFLKKEQELLNKEQELEIQLQKMLIDERSKLSDIIRQEEIEKNRNKESEYQLKLKELEEKFEQQKKLAEEMKRKAEQGSMQTQGEVQELMLEEMLRNAFPYDVISEVAKGVRGADCIQTVRNKFGQDCGKIIFESKRTQAFSAEWIEKLKADMRSQGADVAVIVTQTLPKDLERFGEKDGVWICTFAEAKALVHVLREGIIKVATALKSEENKGDKMHMLYAYLTSNEFGEQWRAIREGFLSMRQSIVRERDAMEKLWKAREKQLEKVMLNMSHFKGSIEGIAGQDFELNLLEDGDDATT